MKKVLLYLVLFSFLLSPVLVLAQEGPKECCKLRRDVMMDGEKYRKGLVVTPRAMKQGECSLLPATTGTPPVKFETEKCVDVAETPPDGVIDQEVGCYTVRWGLLCMMSTIYYVTDWIFTILLLVAVIMMIYGGFTMLTAMGAEESFTRGRNILMYAVAGVGVAVVARLIPAVVRAIIGF